MTCNYELPRNGVMLTAIGVIFLIMSDRVMAFFSKCNYELPCNGVMLTAIGVIFFK